MKPTTTKKHRLNRNFKNVYYAKEKENRNKQTIYKPMYSGCNQRRKNKKRETSGGDLLQYFKKLALKGARYNPGTK